MRKLVVLLGAVVLSVACIAMAEYCLRASGARTIPQDSGIFSWSKLGDWFTLPRKDTVMGDRAIPVRINRFGVRGADIPPKSPGMFRILCLGDSIAFGYEAYEEEMFISLMNVAYERDRRPIEVVNVSMAGWSARQFRIALEKHGDWIDPDLVLFTFVPNDIVELQRGIYELALLESSAWRLRIEEWAKRWVLVAELKRLYARFVDPSWRTFWVVTELFAERDHPTAKLALEQHRREMEELITISVGRGRPIVMMVFPYPTQVGTDAAFPQAQVVADADALGLPVLDLTRELDSERAREWVAEFGHLTQKGNAEVARIIGDWLDREELVPASSSTTDES
jgi:hypothetical protein